MSQPVITPAKWLRKTTLPPELKDCSLALIGFCRFHEMKHKLGAESLSESLFSHLDRSHQFVGQVAGRNILALECLYGGPLSATVLEELAYYGIKQVIGYGYAGSLTRTVPIGQIVLADAALVSDGTSREYLPDVARVYPDQELALHMYACATRIGVAVRGVEVWTTDALYREHPEKVARWRQVGAQIVNMDTSHLYAVSQVVGMSAVYACVVSDCVESQEWDDGFGRIPGAVSELQDLLLTTLTELAAAEPIG